jgi:hypothetical protein
MEIRRERGGRGAVRWGLIEFRTFVFRFVDGAVFVLDEDRKTIELRSASRLGRRGGDPGEAHLTFRIPQGGLRSPRPPE